MSGTPSKYMQIFGQLYCSFFSSACTILHMIKSMQISERFQQIQFSLGTPIQKQQYQQQRMRNLQENRDHSTSITNFLPLDKIGEGSFSSVYKVRRISDDQIYALKKIKIVSLKEKEKQNALNQIRILASLTSLHIVQYREAFFDEKLNLLCIVMELANQGDLQKKIQVIRKDGHYFDEQEIWKALVHTIKGLMTLHRNSILHRDIKSANVFINDGVYKLGDLNVSKVQDSQTRLAYTQTGTPYYASPQVWRDQPYDLKSDIWSLGCVMYEMCTGRPPFKGKDLQSLYKNVQRGIYDRIPLQYSKQLSDVISYCLRKDPKSRLTCKQLLDLASLQKKCLQYNIAIEQQETNQQLLKTIKLPYDLKDLKRKLPKSKYSHSLQQKQYKKTLLKLNSLCQQNQSGNKKISTHINSDKIKRISSQQSIDRNPQEMVKSKKNSFNRSYKNDSKEVTPRSDRAKKDGIRHINLKYLLPKRNESEQNVRKLSQDDPKSGRQIQKQISVLKKLSQPQNKCLSHRYNDDISGVSMRNRDNSTDRLVRKRSIQKKHDQQLFQLQKKVDQKRRELRKIGSIQRLANKNSQNYSYRQPLVLHPKIKQSAAHISQILKSPSSTQDELISSRIDKGSHKKLLPLPQVQKVSSTPYMCGISDVPRMKRILETVHEEKSKKDLKAKILSNRYLPY